MISLVVDPSRIVRTFFLQDMLFPALVIFGFYSHSAEGTLSPTRNALVTLEVTNIESRFASRAELVVFSLCAFIHEMLIQSGKFNDLIAFPASNEHWTFFPIMYVKGFFWETRIVSKTELTGLLLCSSWSSSSSKGINWWLLCLFLLLCSLLLLFLPSSCLLLPLRIDVCTNCLCRLGSLWLCSASVYLSKCLF